MTFVSGESKERRKRKKKKQQKQKNKTKKPIKYLSFSPVFLNGRKKKKKKKKKHEETCSWWKWNDLTYCSIYVQQLELSDELSSFNDTGNYNLQVGEVEGWLISLAGEEEEEGLVAASYHRVDSASTDCTYRPYSVSFAGSVPQLQCQGYHSVGQVLRFGLVLLVHHHNHSLHMNYFGTFANHIVQLVAWAENYLGQDSWSYSG